MSTVVRRRNPPQEPPKKSRVGLIITIIIIIVVIIVIVIVIILVLRSRNTPPPGGCLSDPDCPSGKVCNTVSKVCVGCLTSANCSGTTKVCDAGTNTCIGCNSDANCTGTTPVCDTPNTTCVGCLNNTNCASGQICDVPNKTCIPAQCTTNLDCSSNANGHACNAGVCVQCNSNLDCVNNPVFSGAGKNSCETANHLCKECIADADCLSGACISGTCCSSTAPIITLISSNRGPTSSIGITYTFDQNLTGLKYIIELSDPVSNGVIYLSPQTVTGSVNMTGQVILVDSAIGLIFIPDISYNVRIKIATTCGFTSFSIPSTTTIPVDNSAGATPSPQGSAAGGLMVTLTGAPLCNSNTKAWAVLSKTSNIHPNLAVMIKEMNQTSNTCVPDFLSGLSSCSTIDFSTPWQTGVQPLLGETWFLRVFLSKGYNTGGSIITLGSVSGLSIQNSFSIGL